MEDDWKKLLLISVGEVVVGISRGSIGGAIPLHTNNLKDAEYRKTWVMNELQPVIAKWDKTKNYTCSIQDILINDGYYELKIMFIRKV